jgi:hypothetical protein
MSSEKESVHNLVVAEEGPGADVTSPQATTGDEREQGEPHGLSLWAYKEVKAGEFVKR